MKVSTKFNLLIIVCLFFSVSIFAQHDDAERAPTMSNVESNYAQGMPEAMWDLQFSYAVQDSLSGTGALAGAVFFNGEFWASQWNSDSLFRFDASGQVIERFTINNLSGTRAITWDGTSLWMGNASTTIYEVNPISKTVLSQITVPLSSLSLSLSLLSPSLSFVFISLSLFLFLSFSLTHHSAAAYRPACMPMPVCLPAFLPACLPALLPACLAACLPACSHRSADVACLPGCLPACLAAFLPAPAPACALATGPAPKPPACPHPLPSLRPPPPSLLARPHLRPAPAAAPPPPRSRISNSFAQLSLACYMAFPL